MRIGLRELIFIALLIALPIASFWLAIKPVNEQVASARAEIETKREKLQQLEAATRHIEDLGREIDKLTDAIAVFEAKLPAEKEVEVILKEVWQLAVRNGLKPRTVRADKPIKSARYSELPLRMEIHGEFDGFYGFLLEVERLSRITRVPQMKLKKLRGDETQMEAIFTLTIFFEPQDDGRGQLAQTR